MFVYMLKDVEKIGMKGQLIKVSDGFARNCLVPKKQAVAVSEKELPFYRKKSAQVKVKTAADLSKVGMLAERVDNMHVSIKKRVHDDGKLYGAVSAEDIVDLLKAKDVVVTKKQIEFDKNIRTVGEHKATIRFSSKLKPKLTVKVIGKASE